jgi:hypothetical protein
LKSRNYGKNLQARIARLEEAIEDKDYGLWAVPDLEHFYNPDVPKMYWTDEEVTSDMRHEYRRVKHPVHGWSVPDSLV